MLAYFADKDGFLVSQVNVAMLADEDTSHLIRTPPPDGPVERSMAWRWDGSKWSLSPAPRPPAMAIAPPGPAPVVFNVGPMPEA